MMYFMICVIAIFFLVAILWLFFMLYRNNWVYHNRMALIKNGTLDLYWDYDKMFYTFWILDIEKMRSKV
jgi:uncharacterized membrane protein YqiK